MGSLYIKIIIPTYSRRPPLTENFRDAGRTGDAGRRHELRRYRKSLVGCSPCRAAPERLHHTGCTVSDPQSMGTKTGYTKCSHCTQGRRSCAYTDLGLYLTHETAYSFCEFAVKSESASVTAHRQHDYEGRGHEGGRRATLGMCCLGHALKSSQMRTSSTTAWTAWFKRAVRSA